MQEDDGLGVAYLRALKKAEKENTPTGKVTTAVDPSASGTGPERRRTARYKCGGGVEFRADGGEVRIWARVTDISLSGCYIEMTAPSPSGTSLDLTLDLGGVKVKMKGVVQVTYPFLGMGIKFTTISEENRVLLQEIVDKLHFGSVAMPGAEPEAGRIMTGAQDSPLPPGIADAKAVLSALVKFFQSTPVLTRNKFLDLLHQHSAPVGKP
jgi:hypothetical protein